MAKVTDNSNGFVSTLRASPAGQRLVDEALRLVDVQSGRLAGKVGKGVTALTQMSESGQLPPLGKAAGNLLSGKKPVSAALGAATSTVANKVKSAVTGKLKGGGKGGGQAKAVNIEESIDIGAPLTVVYNQWTQFTEFSRFTKAVESVEQVSETETNWRAKVFKSRRTWKATIQQQVPDHRIVWTSEGSKGSTKGVVTFHPLAEDLTRVLVALEYYPVGFVEKTGNLWRAVGRRTRLDLKNFRRFVMLEGRATGEWRGKIEDGKLVKAADSAEREGRRPRKATAKSGDQDEAPRKSAAASSRRRTSDSRANGTSRSRSQSASAGRRSAAKANSSERKSQPAKRTSRSAS